jgi:hypothetical protein
MHDYQSTSRLDIEGMPVTHPALRLGVSSSMPLMSWRGSLRALPRARAQGGGVHTRGRGSVAVGGAATTCNAGCLASEPLPAVTPLASDREGSLAIPLATSNHSA